MASSTATATETVIPTMGLLPAFQKPSEAPKGLPKVEKSLRDCNFYKQSKSPLCSLFSVHLRVFIDEQRTKNSCPRDKFYYNRLSSFCKRFFWLLRHSHFHVCLLFTKSNYINLIWHKPFSIGLNHQLSSTIQQNHQLCSRFHQLFVNLVFPRYIVQKVLEIGHHIRRR
jgi:hypothetical protein